MQNVDTSLLVWGGYFTATDQKSNKENRWLVCVNINKQEINVVQHEEDTTVYPFKSLMCVFTNMKYDNALMIFFNNGKEPLHFFCDSEQDRDSLHQLLASVPAGKSKEVAIGVGGKADLECECFKKGKLKWASRQMVVVKNRILIFRDNDKSQFPLNMISLLEPNIFVSISDQYEKAIQINSQERPFHFQMKDETEAKNMVDTLERMRQRMIGEAKHYHDLKTMAESKSMMNMRQKGMMNRQEMVSKREMKSTRTLNAANPTQSSVVLPSGSKMKLDLTKEEDASKTQANIQQFTQGMKRAKRLKFDKPFKPGKHVASIFLWGHARPSRMFPQHSNQASPFRHETLSQKRLVYIAAAKDGSHAFGVADNDWTLVWGEANFAAALGLGRDTNSTLPFLLHPLKKQKVVQVECSSRHGLALTLECTVFGWGAKQLTNLPADINTPKILPFLNNLGVTGIACSNTHSAAWHSAHVDVYTWGMAGPWLGFEDVNQQKVFGRVDFHPSVQEDKNLGVSKVECGTQYTLILLTDGLVCASGVNEHGRMGIGQDIPETAKPMFLENLQPIADMSTGPFHAALLTRQGEVFTFGVGADYRLGHGTEDTEWLPRQVEVLKDDPIVRIECVEDRTFAITKFGCVLMWGFEPVTDMVYTTPKIFEYMRPYRIYQICGSKDFTVALGVHAKDPVTKPNIVSTADPMQKKSHQAMVGDISDVVGVVEHVGGLGFQVKQVLGNYVQVEKTVDTENDGPPPPPSSLQLTGSMNRPPQQFQSQNNFKNDNKKKKEEVEVEDEKEDDDSDDEYYRKKQEKFGTGPPAPPQTQKPQTQKSGGPSLQAARPLGGGGPPPAPQTGNKGPSNRPPQQWQKY